ncbi:class II aldolase/adducin family protein [Sedimentibacter sp. MB31-C6]|uniref:class II aldolase/adducin family protein n=1 Tax=Sedimentibacter sp. MB31-C6 TaxID=3109366 RepID=UPI002DDD6530|nr:class II aldolase/adducin family protein [Sedimentibacter sp. MB36-C1]WSI04635.1 class II aldolase/adducin family protein [Sedimentibacter sp. MB36-C1]
MEYSIEKAKELVISAGKMLAESGLIARTWGNISARTSDKKFAITPSGLAYETLTPEQIVVVNIADCSYDGNIKPSSEKGIHADIYRLCPEVNFIIHTHQVMASVLSIEGKDIEVHNDEYKRILGDKVHCAAYGISSTKKLRKRVAEAISNYPESQSILMKNHGTICMGFNLEHSFEIALTLEKMAKEMYETACGDDKEQITQILDYGKSWRKEDTFILECDGKTFEYRIDELPKDTPKVALLHADIYKLGNAGHIIHSTDEEVVKVSSTGKVLRPFLDDLAQIVGVNIKTVKKGLINMKAISKELKNKNAVLLENEGALCTGATKSDTEAASMILRKGCAADLYASALNITDHISIADAYVQRFFYITKYSKMKR